MTSLIRRYAICPDCNEELTAPDGWEFTNDTILCDECWNKKYLKEEQEAEKWELKHRYDDVPYETGEGEND